MELWYPKAVKVVPYNYVGSSMTTYEKQVAHTTEAKNYRPSRDSYYGHQLWPHATGFQDQADGIWKIAEHLPLNRSSACMRNLVGGVETNRDGCIQIEIAWVASEGQLLPDAACAAVSDWFWWVHQQTGIPWKTVDDFHYYLPENNYQLGKEPWRLRGAAFDNFKGILGHQHADENVHGDPGKIPIRKILARHDGAVSVPPTQEGEDMEATFVRELHEIYFGYTKDPTTWTKPMLESYNWHLWQLTSGQANREVTRARFETAAKQAGKL